MSLSKGRITAQERPVREILDSAEAKQPQKKQVWAALQERVRLVALKVGERAKKLHLGASVRVQSLEEDYPQDGDPQVYLAVAPSGAVTFDHFEDGRDSWSNAWSLTEPDPKRLIPRDHLHAAVAHIRELAEALEARVDECIQEDQDGIAKAEELLKSL